MHYLMLRSYYQAKFSPTLSIDQIQLARTEKKSLAIHHKLYLSFAHRSGLAIENKDGNVLVMA